MLVDDRNAEVTGGPLTWPLQAQVIYELRSGLVPLSLRVSPPLRSCKKIKRIPKYDSQVGCRKWVESYRARLYVGQYISRIAIQFLLYGM